MFINKKSFILKNKITFDYYKKKEFRMKKNLVAVVILLTSISIQSKTNNYNLMIGTYTNTGKSMGIYTYTLDIQNQTQTQTSVTSGISNPNYLAITPNKKILYSVSESPEASTAQSFSFDKNTHKLKFINASATNGKGPCYISDTKKHVFTANYGAGSISVFGRNSDGSLTEALQVIQHTGKSINTERQNKPHVHQVLVSPNNKYVLSNDLGTDQVILYKYNRKREIQVLTPADTLLVKAGSGPRHASFSRNGKYIYLVQEIDGTLSVISLTKGKLKLKQETTIAIKKDIVNRGADIHLSPDEKFVYVTNRGTANDISCFLVRKDKTLEFVQQLPTGGDGPRNFAITPDGKYICIANQFTDNITIFKRDIESGKLTPTVMQLQIGAPVCLKFF